MVHDHIAPADGVVVDALAARRVDVVMRPKHERACGRVQVLCEGVAELTDEGARGARAAPDEDFVLLPGRRAGR